MTAMISAMMAMVRVFISRPPSDVGGLADRPFLRVIPGSGETVALHADGVTHGAPAGRRIIGSPGGDHQ